MTAKPAGLQYGDRMLIGIIADEDTTMGFLLAGIGEVINKITNYEIVYSDTPKEVLETAFDRLCHNPNMGVILIGSDIKKKLESSILMRYRRLPIILELPSKSGLNNITRI